MGFNVFLSFHLHGRAENYLLSSAPAHSGGNRSPGLHKLATAWRRSPTLTEGSCEQGLHLVPLTALDPTSGAARPWLAPGPHTLSPSDLAQPGGPRNLSFRTLS